MKKRLLSIFLTILMMTGLVPEKAFAADPIRLLALGDSITAGYGLKDKKTESFPMLLGNDLIVTNKAVNGNTITGIAAQFQTNTISVQEIMAADVITITAGGNDILGFLYAKAAEISLNKTEALDILTDKSNPFLLMKKQEVTDALTAYQQSLTEITTLFRQINPNVRIIVATQFNPYREFADHPLYHPLYAYAEESVNRLNSVITSNAKVGGYIVADVKTAFDVSHSPAKDLYNANPDMNTLDLDFHPSAAGHAVLAEVFRTVIADSDKLMEQTPAANFTPCTRAQFITLLWHQDGSPIAKQTRMPFTDVSAHKDYYNAVLWALENGITAGTSDTTFSPDAVCTNAQTTVFLQRFLNRK